MMLKQTSCSFFAAKSSALTQTGMHPALLENRLTDPQTEQDSNKDLPCSLEFDLFWCCCGEKSAS